MSPKSNRAEKSLRKGPSHEGESLAALSGRKMPESLEAEVSVLGSMILDRECIGEIVQQLRPEDFNRAEHRAIFDGLLGLYEKGGPVDGVLLRDELRRAGTLDSVGGAKYILEVVNSVPSSANAVYYSQIVKNKALLRELISASSSIINDAYEEGGEVENKLDAAEQLIFAVTHKKLTTSSSSVKDLLVEILEDIQGRTGEIVTGLPTGFGELDHMLCGLQRGEMIIIAGRPSMGKTSFALNVAEHIGADNNVPIAVFSLEMGCKQLVERILCSRGHLDSQAVRRGNLDPDQESELVHSAGELSEKPIYIDDTAGLTPLELRAKARRLKSQHDIQCIVIDYLQLMSSGGRVESRQQEITTISRHVKSLARELDVPVVILSQLNRSPEGREGHRPRMSDLRESGSLEQDADVVLLLHREDYYHRGEVEYEDTGKAEVIVAKQRNGPTGVVELTFLEQYTRFGELAPDHIKEPF